MLQHAAGAGAAGAGAAAANINTRRKKSTLIPLYLCGSRKKRGMKENKEMRVEEEQNGRERRLKKSCWPRNSI